MGALALSTGLRIGARDVLAVDVNDQRLQAMRTLGASASVNVGSPDGRAEVLQLAGPGFDVVIDAQRQCGSSPNRFRSLPSARPGCPTWYGGQRSEVDFVTGIRKEHRVVMSFAYTPVDFDALWIF
jgi:threonine dehydrogenase-like Zn-dependent dehydrogenase